MKLPIAGGAPVTLSSSTEGGVGAIGVNGGNVYWLANDATVVRGAVVSVPVGGGTATTLASGFDQVTSIALNANSVFWCDYYGVRSVTPK